MSSFRANVVLQKKKKKKKRNIAGKTNRQCCFTLLILVKRAFWIQQKQPVDFYAFFAFP